jgi:RNA polymerase sigma-70 factor (ECF subfamily)
MSSIAETTDAARVRLLKRFTAAVEAQDEQTLLALFAPDATWTADGGGQVSAARRPIVGAERIVKLVISLQQKFYRGRAAMHLAEVNGETGLVVRTNGQITSIVSMTVEGDRIHDVYAVLNPDKLGVTTGVAAASSNER